MQRFRGSFALHRRRMPWWRPALLSLLLLPALALADGEIKLSIPAGSLSSALSALAEQADLQLVYNGDLVKGMSSTGLKGAYAPQTALQTLLQGTGLVFRFTSRDTVLIERASSSGGAKLLGPVRVQGASADGGLAGINGSTDATATEGTNSYTSSALSIASKTPQSLKETPQSVSVITQQRIQDQNLTDFSSVMNQATGITIVAGNAGGGSTSTGSNLTPAFYSRGFLISNIQVDGGAPLNTASGGDGAPAYSALIDMAMYDHVEVLRGADGLFNGYGDPSGSVNLTRKRPLDHEQVVVELGIGSWKDSREVIDATAPLAFDGKLRGRFVLSHQDQDYFYNTASNEHTLAYGILEGDLTASTLLSVGFSDTRQNAVTWEGGLPRYANGDDLELPRSTCLCFPWNRWDFDTQEVFVQAEQRLGADWSVKVNATRNDQTSHKKYGYVGDTAPVNPVTDAGPDVDGRMQDFSGVQTLADFTVNGAFNLFGHRQQVVFGGSYQEVNGDGYKSYGFLYPNYMYPAVDVFNFNTSDPRFAEPAASLVSSQYPLYRDKQSGAYATLRLTLLDPLHVIIGLRYSRYDYDTVDQALCTKVNASCSSIGAVESTSAYGFGEHHLSSPDVALVYDLTKAVSAYVSYTDIYQPQSTDVDESGKPIGPITGSNVEAGLKWEGFSGALNASLAAYRIEQDNYGLFIGYGPYADSYGDTGDGIHYCCYTNGSNQVNLSKGVDLEVTGQVLPGWQLFAGYTFNQNKAQGTDAYNNGQPLVSRTPRHLFKLWTDYQFRNGEFLHRLSVGGGVNAQTASFNSGSACVGYVLDANGNRTPVCQPGENLPYNFTQGFYAVFSGRVAYKIDTHWSLALNLNNIADRRYYQTMGDSEGGNWYGDPRNFMLTLRGSF